MTDTVEFTIQLVRHVCPHCSGVFAITREYQENCRELGNFKQVWACPYCKITRGYGDAEVDRLRADIAAKDREISIQIARRQKIQADLDMERVARCHTEAERNGLKGALAKVKKRVAGGACPCCNRSFADLHRHMKTKHPTYAKP